MNKAFSFIICFCLVFSMPFISNGVSAQTDSDFSMVYDTFYTFTGYKITDIKSNRITSFKTGYSAQNNIADDEVLKKYNENTILSTATGNATVTLQSETDDDIIVTKTIEVIRAPISMIFLLGQSNAEGTTYNNSANSQYKQSIKCPEKQVYSTYAPSGNASADYYTSFALTKHLNLNPTDGESGENFVASALAGDNSNIANSGTELQYKLDTLTNGGGKSGIDSGLGYQWVKSTNEKVWIINAAHQGTSINSWNPETENSEFKQAESVMKSAVSTMENELAAGHFEFQNLSYVWIQGESDLNMSASDYTQKFTQLNNAIIDNIKIDTNSDGQKDMSVQKCGLVATRVCGQGIQNYKINDIYMNGQRVSHYDMAIRNDGVYKNIIMACNIGDRFVTDRGNKETSSIKDYFESHYEGTYPNDIKLDYSTQSAAPVLPLTAKDVLYQFHYCQTIYNEIGIETSKNLLYSLEKIKYSGDKSSPIFYKQDGYNVYSANDLIAVDSSTGMSDVVSLIGSPVFEPLKIDCSDIEGSYENGIITAKKSGKILVTNTASGNTYNFNIEVIKYGDCNSDGKVDCKDTLILAKHLAGLNTKISLNAADVLKSGKINSADRLKLQKYLSNQENIILGSDKAMD